MRAVVILGCVAVFLILCLAGVGGLLWQRARVAQTQARYARMVQQEALMAARAAEARDGLNRRAVAEKEQGEFGSETLQESISRITYGDEDDRVAGLLQLAPHSGNTETRLEALIPALRDDSPAVRVLAAALLATMGKEATPAARALSQALEDASLREVALYALRSIGPAAVEGIPILEKLAEEAKPEVQEAAKKALEAIRR